MGFVSSNAMLFGAWAMFNVVFGLGPAAVLWHYIYSWVMYWWLKWTSDEDVVHSFGIQRGIKYRDFEHGQLAVVLRRYGGWTGSWRQGGRVDILRGGKVTRGLDAETLQHRMTF